MINDFNQSARQAFTQFSVSTLLGAMSNSGDSTYRHECSSLFLPTGFCIKVTAGTALDGYYRIFESSTAEKYEYIGIVSVDVHKDLLNDDHVISIVYSDRYISDYIKRSTGKFRW